MNLTDFRHTKKKRKKNNELLVLFFDSSQGIVSARWARRLTTFYRDKSTQKNKNKKHNNFSTKKHERIVKWAYGSKSHFWMNRSWLGMALGGQSAATSRFCEWLGLGLGSIMSW